MLLQVELFIIRKLAFSVLSGHIPFKVLFFPVLNRAEELDFSTATFAIQIYYYTSII